MRFLIYLKSMPNGKWVSLLVGMGFLLNSAACALQGDTTNALGYLISFMGTLGLPAIVGPGYEIAIVKTEQADLSPPPLPK